jgi:hypothetical protein
MSETLPLIRKQTRESPFAAGYVLTTVPPVLVSGAGPP